MMLRELVRLRFGGRDARIAACKALAESGSRLAVPFLVRAARRDGHVWVRDEAIQALGVLGGSWARKALVQALGSPDWEVRAAAVSALGCGGHLDAVEAVTGRLSDESALVRRIVPWALVKLAGRDAIPLVSPAIRDGDSDVRAAAVGALGGAEVLAPLVRAAGDLDRGVRKAALEALARIDPAWATSATAREVADRALGDLGHPDWRTGARAAHVLAVVPTPDPAPLVAALAVGDADLRDALVKGLALRGWTPSNIEEAVRVHLAGKDWKGLRALGELGFERCLEMARDVDRVRRVPAIEGLCQFGDTAHAARVVALLSEESNADIRQDVFRALLEAKDIALDREHLCRRYLRDADLKHMAAGRLSRFLDLRDLDPLIAYLMDGGNAWNEPVVTVLGDWLRRGRLDGATTKKIERCMKWLAARGDEEAAAVLWLAERGE